MSLIAKIKFTFKKFLVPSEKQVEELKAYQEWLALDTTGKAVTVEKNEAGEATYKRLPVEIEVTIPSVEEFIEDEKGVAVLQSLIKKAAQAIAKVAIDEFQVISNVSINDIIDHLTPSRKAAAPKVNITMIKLGVAEFVDFLATSGLKKNLIVMLAQMMHAKFDPALLAGQSENNRTKIQEFFMAFVESLEEDTLEKLLPLITVLTENIEEALTGETDQFEL